MNLQQLRLVAAIADTGSFTKAGEVCGYTQSSVTQMMKKLETEFGLPLFIKGRSGAELTREGEELLPWIRQMLNDEDKLHHAIDERRGLRRGTLQVGAHVSCAIAWRAALMDVFHTKYPGVELTIAESGQRLMVRDLLERRLDLAIMSEPLPGDPIDFVPLMGDSMVIIFPAEHELASYDRVPLDALREMPFILSSPEYDTDAERLFAAAEFEPQVRFRSISDFSLLASVRSGLGVGVMPKLLMKDLPFDDLDYRELDPPFERIIGIGMLSEKALGPVEKVFVKELKQILAEWKRGERKIYEKYHRES